ncbi:MAG: helix-turn-helix domain-containing protein [Clostridia bacterium]|nr:helix-turn-helix domain-containing protein [Clostridia bacterium]
MADLNWKQVTLPHRGNDGVPYTSSLDSERIRTASLENLQLTVFFEGDFSKYSNRIIAQSKRGYIHSHTHYEFLCVAQGCLEVFFDDRCLALTAGNLVIIPPGVFHKSHLASDEAVYQVGQFFYSENPQPIYADLYSHFHAVFGGNEILQVTADDELLHAIYALAACGQRSGALENMRFISQFQTMLLLLCDRISPFSRDFHAERGVVDDHDLIIRYEISTYLNHRYKNNPSLPELAAGLRISERQLDRRIREMYGQSFMERVTEMRMRSAKHELLYTGYGIGEIASHIGYNSVKNFFAAFKKYYNQTPEQFRKQAIPLRTRTVS